jgi:serine/threonine protein kinase
MHRDLKPENIMFSETIHNLKLIDFGLTTKEPGKVKCGTAGYIAPEILNLEPCLN